jgi:DNA-binding NtrC family response regulator
MANESILVVDDDPIIRKSLQEMLRLEGYQVETASDGTEALRRLEQSSIDVVLTDVKMPALGGFELLAKIKTFSPDTVVILITGYGSIEDAVNGIKAGAYEYITKPLNDDEIKLVIDRSLEHLRLRKENESLKRSLSLRFNFSNLLGRDTKMQKVFSLVETVAETEATVLIHGESGTGKTMVARCIHHNSPRTNAPLVEISCGALPENLLESELFGHVKGSFTGAVATKIGKFEAAKGGTVFLDEIDVLPLPLQVKLLRVLQDRKFEKIGSNETVTADVRVIAAANQDLEALVEAGNFRRDVYYRLNVVPVYLPPLRERVGDIPLLAEHFVQKYAERNHKDIAGISEEALEVMCSYGWGGNVRELENAIERAIILCKGRYLTSKDFPFTSQGNKAKEPEAVRLGSLKEELEVAEKGIIEAALKQNNWNRHKTAAMLDINRTTLYHKMKKYGWLQKQPN